jgi:hypothetical protein
LGTDYKSAPAGGVRLIGYGKCAWDALSNYYGGKSVYIKHHDGGMATFAVASIIFGVQKFTQFSKVAQLMDFFDVFTLGMKAIKPLANGLFKSGKVFLKYLKTQKIFQLVDKNGQKTPNLELKWVEVQDIHGNKHLVGLDKEVEVSSVDKKIEIVSDPETGKNWQTEEGYRIAELKDGSGEGQLLPVRELAEGVDNLLTAEGKFIDNALEGDYQKYLTRKAAQGKVPHERLDWKEARDYWLNDSPMARGNAFNKKAWDDEWYPYWEVYLENGKYVDGYDPIAKEIISRKATNLEDIDISTFEAYLKEMKNKYAPGTIIKSKKPNYDKLFDTPLEGRQILEIPSSNQNFSNMQEYIDLAKNKYQIDIRFKPE